MTLFRVSLQYIGVDHPSSYELFMIFISFVGMFVGSCAIGYSFGIFMAIVYKFMDFSENPVIGVSVIVLTIFLPFMISEFIEFSGIVSIFFAGVMRLKKKKKSYV